MCRNQTQIKSPTCRLVFTVYYYWIFNFDLFPNTPFQADSLEVQSDKVNYLFKGDREIRISEDSEQTLPSSIGKGKEKILPSPKATKTPIQELPYNSATPCTSRPQIGVARGSTRTPTTIPAELRSILAEAIANLSSLQPKWVLSRILEVLFLFIPPISFTFSF